MIYREATIGILIGLVALGMIGLVAWGIAIVCGVINATSKCIDPEDDPWQPMFPPEDLM